MTRKNATNTGITTQGTPVNLSRAGTATGLLPAEMFAVTQANFNLSAASGVQTAFPSTCDVWTLEGTTTYEFWGQYLIDCGTTSHSIAMAFASAGGLTFTSIKYTAWGFNGIANATVSAQGSVRIDTNASTVVTAAATTAGNNIMFRGIMRINAGGTLTPQIAFSANPTGTNIMLEGSYIFFKPLGSNTVETFGSVA